MIMEVKPKTIIATPGEVKMIQKYRRLVIREAIKNPHFFGCFTGDCPHSTQRECDIAIFNWALEESPYQLDEQVIVLEEWRLTGLVPFNDDIYIHKIQFKDLNQYHFKGKLLVAIDLIDGDWQPAPLMPIEFSRLKMELIKFKVQRLGDKLKGIGDLTSNDCYDYIPEDWLENEDNWPRRGDGVTPTKFNNIIYAFKAYWNSQKPDHLYSTNLWNWVHQFKIF